MQSLGKQRGSLQTNSNQGNSARGASSQSELHRKSSKKIDSNDPEDVAKENSDLKETLNFVLSRVAAMETRFSALETSLRAEISELRR